MSDVSCPLNDHSTCEHRMFPRCPFCNQEQYGPGVFAFSHAIAPCWSCGERVTPETYAAHVIGEGCALCGHPPVSSKCGQASVTEAGVERFLCHADDHSCYHRWTVYGERPKGEDHV